MAGFGTPSREEKIILQKIAECLKQQPHKLAVISNYYCKADKRVDMDQLVTMVYPLIDNERAFMDFLEIRYSEIESTPTLVSLKSKTVKNYNLQKAGFGEQRNVLNCEIPVLLVNLIEAYNMLPESTQDELQKDIGTFVNLMFCYQNDVVSLATTPTIAVTMTLKLAKSEAAALTIGTILVAVTSDIHTEMNRWWYKEISGKRCAKNIIDNMAATAGGWGGGYGGAAIGTLIDRGTGIATITSAIIGGWFGRFIANALADLVTEKIFIVPATKGGSVGK